MRGLWVLSSALLVLACGRDASFEVSKAKEPSASESAQLHFAGDVYFGESYDSTLTGASDARRYDEPLARLGAVLSSAPTVANFESTVSASSKPALMPQKDYLHWSRPEVTSHALARHGFVGLSLSNNHAMDFGLEALVGTRRELAAKGMTPFGAGATSEEAKRPYEIELHAANRSVPVSVIGMYWLRPKYRDLYRVYANAEHGGVRELALSDITAQIEEIRTSDPARTIVVFPHWGRNYRWRNHEQRDLARALIDAGADLVIGHGAHVYQEVERYRDRWILYGLGNLVFLTPGRYDDNDIHPYSMLATVRWTARRDALEKELLLRFIASDNRRTAYLPHLVEGDEFQRAIAPLMKRSCRRDDTFCVRSQVVADDLGPHIRLPM